MSKNFHIVTYGCQANLADSERIAEILEQLGYNKTESDDDCDILVFNTCSVKQKAEDRVFGLNKKFRDLKIHNPKLKIVLTGCMTHYSEEEIGRRLPYADIFLKEISDLPQKLNFKKVKTGYGKVINGTSLIPISNGCNNFCSYCIVPFARGREVHRPVKEIITDVKKAVKNGAKEIWLLGQNVNSYKSVQAFGKNSSSAASAKSDGSISFAGLLRLVNAVKGDFWVRFTSPHPKDFPDDLIKAMAECEKFPHYLNLPIQSGNDEVLKRMRRPYTVAKYKTIIKKLRSAMPGIALSTDIIVGFPGETKKQFKDTIKLFKELKFDMAYISEYSPRPKTFAAEHYKDNVPHEEKERRKIELNEVLKKTSAKYNKSLVGKVVIALNGRTEHNKPIRLEGGSKMPKNEFVKIKVTKSKIWSMEGVRVN